MPAAGRADGKHVEKKHWSYHVERSGRRETVCGRHVAPKGIAGSLDDITCKVCRAVLHLPEQTPEKRTLRVEVRQKDAKQAATLLGGTAAPALGTMAFNVIEVTSAAFPDTQAVIDFLRRREIRAWDVLPF